MSANSLLWGVRRTPSPREEKDRAISVLACAQQQVAKVFLKPLCQKVTWQGDQGTEHTCPPFTGHQAWQS